MKTWWTALLGAAAAVVIGAVLSRDDDYPGTAELPDGDGQPVDPYASLEPPTSFDPTPKEGVKLFRRWVIDRWGQRPGSPENIGRWDRTDKPSDHHEGRAWDLMTNSAEHGQQVVDALLAPDPRSGEPNALARRAGITYLIWQRRMWRAYPHGGQPSGSWAPYSGASPHTDHIHFSFSRAGAAGKTTLYDELRRTLPVA